jgi:Scramblase
MYDEVAREIFTDARQYVLRLDPSYDMSAEDIVKDPTTLTSGAFRDTDNAGARRLGLDERAVLLATAISIDFGK